MRWWTLAALAALVACTSAGHEDNEIMQALKAHAKASLDHTWQQPQSEEHHVSKRAANQLLFATGQCQLPGFVGPDCKYPVCKQTNPYVPDQPVTNDEGAPIDGGFLVNCTQQYLTYVDETMHFIRVSINSESFVNPSFVLIDAAGNSYPPDFVESQDATHYTGVYRLLYAGVYAIQPSSDTPSLCYFTMHAKTELTVEAGFVYGAGLNSVRDDYPIPGALFHEPMTFVAHGNKLKNAARLTSIAILQNDNLVTRPQTLETRFNCSYEYYAEQTFYCLTTGTYLAFVEGYDFRGNQFRRLKPFKCLLPDPTPSTSPVTTPTPAPLTSCDNHGILMPGWNGQMECFCPPMFSGRDCSVPNCANGGVVGHSQMCECPDGFTGQFCEHIQCSDSAGFGFSADAPTLVLVVRVRKQMSDVITQIAQAVTDIASTLEFDPEYLRRFQLVLFNNNNLILQSTYRSALHMVSDLQNAAVTPDTTGNCSDAVFTATVEALQSTLITNKSPIYVISDALPDDYKRELDTLFHLDSYYRSPINFVYVVPTTDPANPCVPSVEDPGFRAMDDITQRTSGMAMFIGNRSTVYSVLFQHMWHTIYRSQLVNSNDLMFCTGQNLYKPISVDRDASQLVLVAKGKGLSPYITDPNGNQGQFQLKFQSEDLSIWMINGVVSGTWMFNLLSSTIHDGCSWRIYQKSYHAKGFERSQHDIFWAFTPNMNLDGNLYQPVHNMDTGIVVHITNYPMELPPERVFAEMTVYASREGKQFEIYASNGLWRDGCSFQFYFPPFSCQRMDETLYFNFFAKDALGFMIQRAGVMYCTGTHPTFFPPTGCQNGGVPDSANSTICHCPPGFSGDQCQVVDCINGGTSQGGFCTCPPGFIGQHCEFVACITESFPPPEVIRKGVDMIFVVELTQQAYPQLVALNQYFAEIIRDVVDQHPYWIEKFVLAGFNSTWGGVLAESHAWDASSIIGTMGSIAAQQPTDNGCVVKPYQALYSTLHGRTTRPGSFYNLFISSPPEDNAFHRGIFFEEAKQNVYQLNGYVSYLAASGGSFYCNANGTEFESLEGIARQTEGRLYKMQPAVIKEAIRMFPLLYSSGTVYGRFFQNCTTPQYVGFPIDAYTQTIQINTLGYKSSVQLFNGHGKEFPNLNELVDDTVSGWNIFEARRACDPDWDQVGQYCIRFDIAQVNYTVAQMTCQAAGGSLVDVLTKDKQNYLDSVAGSYSYWTGLNDMAGAGQFVWDRYGNTSGLPLNVTAYNGFPGQVVPTDQTKRCVYDSAASGWQVDNCAANRRFVCQKHMYDQDFKPAGLDEDDLPPGKWYLSIQTQEPPLGNRLGDFCFVEIKVQSSLQVYSAYTTDIHSDMPESDPVAGSTANRFISYVHSVDNEHRSPLLTHALIYAESESAPPSMAAAATYEPRAHCSFPWVSQDWACPNSQDPNNAYVAVHAGEDEFGNAFQRISHGHCEPATLNCGNGGLRYNGSCVCSDYWTGKYCTVPVCVNGGKLNQYSTGCDCPAGFTGPACQFELCTPMVPATFTDDARSLVLVIEATQQNKPALQSIAANFTATLNSLPSSWFTNYLIVAFNAQQETFSGSMNNVADAQTALNKIISGISDQGSCSMPLFSALSSALFNSQIKAPNSEVFFITQAAMPSDADSRKAPIEQLAELGAHLHYVYVRDECGVLPVNGSFTHIARLAYASGGQPLFTSGASAGQLFGAYLPTLYGSSSLTNPTFFSDFTCSNGVYYVSLDKNSTDVYITTSSTVGSLSVMNSQNQAEPTNLIYNGVVAGNSKIYHVSTLGVSGIYQLSISSPGACYVHVAAVGGVQVFTGFVQPSTADPSGQHTDNVAHNAVVGAQNLAVFHVYHPMNARHEARLTYVEMFDPVHKKKVLSSLYRRGGCSYEYFSDPFQCGMSDEGFNMLVYGVDEYGQQFRRQQFVFCLNGTINPVSPTPNPWTTVTPPLITTPIPVTTTVPPLGPSSYQLDIVFMVDVSATGKAILDDATKFIQTLMTSYTVSQDKARVGIITVAGSSGNGFAIANLNSIGNSATMNSNLASIRAFDDFGATGEYLGEALSNAINPSFFASGYRSTVPNHLLVYIGGNTKFSDNAAAIASNILGAKNYGVVAVGYGQAAQVSQSDLLPIAHGLACVFTPKDFHSLSTATVSGIQNLIQTANGNGGGYC